MQIFKDYSLLHANTFGIDQKCDEYVVYDSEKDAVELAVELRRQGEEPFLLLGGGSNLLLTKDFHGKVLTPAKRFDISVIMEYGTNVPSLRCWAGTCFDDVVDYAVRHGYYGLENLSLIPGECGATAVQNIGAYGVEIKELLTEIEAVEIASGRVVKIDARDCAYAYRESRFKHEWKDKFIITYVTYRLSRTFCPKIDYGNIRGLLQEEGIGESVLTASVLRDVIISIRQSKLPDYTLVGNAGSFFMNPIVDEATFVKLKARHQDLRYFEAEPSGAFDKLGVVNGEDDNGRGVGMRKWYKIPTGWMIEKCGWKGRSVGNVGVHEKQALILVNRGGATGKEVVDLMHAIQQDVKATFGLEIKPEVNII